MMLSNLLKSILHQNVSSNFRRIHPTSTKLKLKNFRGIWNKQWLYWFSNLFCQIQVNLKIFLNSWKICWITQIDRDLQAGWMKWSWTQWAISQNTNLASTGKWLSGVKTSWKPKQNKKAFQRTRREYSQCWVHPWVICLEINDV